MKKDKKKLTLSKETIVKLDALTEVQGGYLCSSQLPEACPSSKLCKPPVAPTLP